MPKAISQLCITALDTLRSSLQLRERGESIQAFLISKYFMMQRFPFTPHQRLDFCQVYYSNNTSPARPSRPSGTGCQHRKSAALFDGASIFVGCPSLDSPSRTTPLIHRKAARNSHAILHEENSGNFKVVLGRCWVPLPITTAVLSFRLGVVWRGMRSAVRWSLFCRAVRVFGSEFTPRGAMSYTHTITGEHSN